MSFVALEVALQVVKELGPIVPRIAQRDRALADQVRRAASSIALNLAEGKGRAGGDRLHCFRIAQGSCAEVRAALEVATSWGYLAAETPAAIEARLDRLAGLLYGLTRR